MSIRSRLAVNAPQTEGAISREAPDAAPGAIEAIAREDLGSANSRSHGMVKLLLSFNRKAAGSAGLALLTAIAAIHPVLGQAATRGQNSEQPAAVASGTLSNRPEGDLVVSPDDLLRIDIFDVPQLSGQFRVSPAGTISLPLMSAPIRAAGATPQELSQRVAARLQASGLVSHPRVTIAVELSRVHSVAIGGAVRKPQIYPLFGRITLLDALAQAGGISDDAGDIAIITRGSAGRCEPNDPPPAGCGGPSRTGWVEPGAREPARIVVDLKQLMRTGSPRFNVYLYPGDSVTVQHAGVIYVAGAVNHPGEFALTGSRDPMTVLNAIALAGDLKSTAARNRAVIMRPEPGSPKKRRMIEVNLDRIFKGRVSDPPLQASDVLFIPDSATQKTLRRAAEAAVQVATGVAIFRQ